MSTEPPPGGSPPPRDYVLDALARAGNRLAHGLNNLLMAISGYLEIAAQHVPTDHPASMPLGEGTRAVERFADALHRLMGFARRLHLDPRAFDVAAFLRRRRAALERMADPDAETVLHLEVPESPLPVLADPTALEEALAILLGNAFDATEGRGNVTLRAEAVPGPEAGSPPWVRISVSDDGPGLSEEVRERVFEPFVTTKSKRGALGLSLAWLRGFARQSGGEVAVASRPGHATTFVLRLPPPGAADPSLEDAEAPGGHGERILLVEGDGGVRRTASAVLRSLGYEVASVEDSDAALEAAQASPPPQAAVVALLLPRGLDGATLARRLEATCPGLPVILVASASPLGAPGRMDHPVLRRPFGWADLALAVRIAIDRR